MANFAYTLTQEVQNFIDILPFLTEDKLKKSFSFYVPSDVVGIRFIDDIGSFTFPFTLFLKVYQKNDFHTA